VGLGVFYPFSGIWVLGYLVDLIALFEVLLWGDDEISLGYTWGSFSVQLGLLKVFRVHNLGIHT